MSVLLRIRPPCWLAAAALAVLASGHGIAHAWTQARVTGVAAHLDVAQPRLARVTLDVHVQVSGGWLSRLELVGLDPDLVLAGDAPPLLTAADGSQYSPTAEVTEPGSVVLVFANRHAAPWRGEYTASISYDTNTPWQTAQVVNDRKQRLTWTLPRWEVELSDVRVVVRAPAGTRPAVAEAQAGTYGDQALARELADQTTELTFSRVQLPRTQAFQVTFDVPGLRAAPSDASTAKGHDQAPAPSLDGAQTNWLLIGGLLLGLLALAKRKLTGVSAQRHQLTVQALLLIPAEAQRALLVLGCCGAAGGLWARMPLLAGWLAALGIACALDRSLRRQALPASTIFRTATAKEVPASWRLRIKEQLSAAALLDVSCVPGALLLAALHAYGLRAALSPASLDAYRCAVLLATPLFFTATRLHRPLSAAHALVWLAHVRRKLEALDTHSELLIATTAQGELLEARLRLSPTSIVAGTGKLELLVADGSFYGRHQPTLSLLAICQAHSPADAILQRALPQAEPLTSPDGKHSARLCVTLTPEHDASQLLRWLSPANAGHKLARAA